MTAGSTVEIRFDDTLIAVDLTVHDDTDDREGRAELVVPSGVRTLAERHIHHDPPLPEELTNAIGEMMDHIEDAKRELPGITDVDLVVVRGVTPAVIAAVELGGPVADAEFVLTRDAAEDVFRTLATESSADRRHNPGLPLDLVDVIVGGCCALVGLMRGLQLDSVTVMTRATMPAASANGVGP